MTLHEKIAQARLLAERATPGPWEDVHPNADEGDIRVQIYHANKRTRIDGSDAVAWKVREGDAAFIAQSRTLLPALAEALAIAVSALEHECCCIGDEGPADVCSACLAVREIGKKMGVEG